MSTFEAVMLSSILWVPIGACGALVAQAIAAANRERKGHDLIVPFEACGVDPSFDLTVVPGLQIENDYTLDVDDEELPTVRVQVPNVTRRERGIR